MASLLDANLQQQPKEVRHQFQGVLGQRRKEIYKYSAPFGLYASGWSTKPDHHLKFRLAVGSFIEEYNNKVSIVQLQEEQGEFAHIGTFEHPYPATKVLWIPDPKGNYPDLLATTGDYLRLWRVGGGIHNNGVSLEVRLDNIATSSIDTTCTIWQIETGQAVATTERAIEGNVKTQLIAHDKEVFDVEFSKLSSGRDIFASADLRHMEYSTIVFEEPSRKPLLRLAWNKQDHNFLATFAQNSNEIFILDIRIPSMPVSVLKNHTGSVNGIAWAPHSACHLVTAAEDCQALIWDVHQIRAVEDPILAYLAGGEVF
uniref:WD_REPEATS_REGION domain-containing protein n=1 Tax=Meloidogyne hapla TaxID=6305 RepID=A0A1I8BZ59_MELHA